MNPADSIPTDKPLKPFGVAGTGAEGPATVAIAAKHWPVPEKSEQAKSRKLLAQVYATDMADRSVVARRALAHKLLQTASQSADAPSDQFVLLMGASVAAREAVDLPLCFQAMDGVIDMFEVVPCR